MLSHSSRTHRFILTGALCAALLGGGCGGDSDEDKAKEYREGLTEADKKFDQELTQAGSTMRQAGQAKSQEQYGEGVEQLRAAADGFRDDLGKLDPPDDVVGKQRAAASAVDQFAAAVDRINEAVQADDLKSIQAEAVTVQNTGARVDRTIDELKEAVE